MSEHPAFEGLLDVERDVVLDLVALFFDDALDHAGADIGFIFGGIEKKSLYTEFLPSDCHLELVFGIKILAVPESPDDGSEIVLVGEIREHSSERDDIDVILVCEDLTHQLHPLLE